MTCPLGDRALVRIKHFNLLALIYLFTIERLFPDFTHFSFFIMLSRQKILTCVKALAQRNLPKIMQGFLDFGFCKEDTTQLC